MIWWLRLVISILTGILPLCFFLARGIEIKYPIIGLFISITYSILGEIKIQKQIKSASYLNVQSDVDFALYIIEELRHIDLKYNRIISNKFIKLEEIILRCMDCIGENNVNYKKLNLHLGTVNMWMSTFENETKYETKRYKNALQSLRTFFKQQLSKKGIN